MKKTILLSMFCLTLISLCAQVANPQSIAEVAPCTGTNNTKPLDIGEKSIMFNQASINLNKYDWSNLHLNCHINETLMRHKTSKSMKSIGWVLLGSGAGMLVGAAMSSGAKKLGGNDGGAGMFIGLGSASIVGSIPLFIGGANNKKKKDYHMRQVMDYYQKKGW